MALPTFQAILASLFSNPWLPISPWKGPPLLALPPAGEAPLQSESPWKAGEFERRKLWYILMHPKLSEQTLPMVHGVGPSPTGTSSSKSMGSPVSMIAVPGLISYANEGKHRQLWWASVFDAAVVKGMRVKAFAAQPTQCFGFQAL